MCVFAHARARVRNRSYSVFFFFFSTFVCFRRNRTQHVYTRYISQNFIHGRWSHVSDVKFHLIAGFFFLVCFFFFLCSLYIHRAQPSDTLTSHTLDYTNRRHSYGVSRDTDYQIRTAWQIDQSIIDRFHDSKKVKQSRDRYDKQRYLLRRVKRETNKNWGDRTPCAVRSMADSLSSIARHLPFDLGAHRVQDNITVKFF